MHAVPRRPHTRMAFLCRVTLCLISCCPPVPSCPVLITCLPTQYIRGRGAGPELVAPLLAASLTCLDSLSDTPQAAAAAAARGGAPPGAANGTGAAAASGSGSGGGGALLDSLLNDMAAQPYAPPRPGALAAMAAAGGGADVGGGGGGGGRDRDPVLKGLPAASWPGFMASRNLRCVFGGGAYKDGWESGTGCTEDCRRSGYEMSGRPSGGAPARCPSVKLEVPSSTSTNAGARGA